ncbi:MAG: hypothetical protein ACYCW6_31450 [Candidatus Xenobia bacterium]
MAEIAPSAGCYIFPNSRQGLDLTPPRGKYLDPGDHVWAYGHFIRPQHFEARVIGLGTPQDLPSKPLHTPENMALLLVLGALLTYYAQGRHKLPATATPERSDAAGTPGH